MSSATPVSRVQRVRHELKRRNVEVVRVQTISPHFKSITFTGEALGDFVSSSFDDHVKFMLDNDNDNTDEPVRRDYTPRKYDTAARELTIEFAVHSDGRAAHWAAQATAGQQATIGGPRGSFIIPNDYDWHLLVGDETALPAIHRRLEELPAATRAIVVLQVCDMADRRELRSAADITVQWVETTSAMLDAVRALDLPGGEGYSWCAGEASAMASLRRLLIEENGLDGHAMRVAAYWKRNASAHHENLVD